MHSLPANATMKIVHAMILLFLVALSSISFTLADSIHGCGGFVEVSHLCLSVLFLLILELSFITSGFDFQVFFFPSVLGKFVTDQSEDKRCEIGLLAHHGSSLIAYYSGIWNLDWYFFFEICNND